MSDERTAKEREEQVLGLLGLALDASATPAGPAPGTEEIAAWCEGRLDAGRASEVQAHVARGGAPFQIWLACVREREVPVASPAVLPGPVDARGVWRRRRSHRWRWTRRLAVAAVLLIGVALGWRWQADVVPLPEEITDNSSDVRVTLDAAIAGLGFERLPPRAELALAGVHKALPGEPPPRVPLAADIRTAFQRGMRAALATTAAPGVLDGLLAPAALAAPASCAGDDDSCEARRALGYAAGRWSLAVYAYCGAGPTTLNEDNMRIQARALAALASAYEQRQAGTKAAYYVRAWSAAVVVAAEPSPALCRGALSWLRAHLHEP